MDYYDEIASGYDGLYGQEQESKFLLIKRNIAIGKKTRILDVGCGTGISSSFECFVVGIDPSMELLRLNRKSMKLLGTAEQLPFRNNAFDYVISVTSIHNFEDVQKSIDEMKRTCKENFILSILKKSKNFGLIKGMIEKNFHVYKCIEDGKDAIFFCKKP